MAESPASYVVTSKELAEGSASRAGSVTVGRTAVKRLGRAVVLSLRRLWAVGGREAAAFTLVRQVGTQGQSGSALSMCRPFRGEPRLI